ncbi:hypothetical protein PHLCEN_2v10223 [Hermanssonia centrifuga]|uniref:Malate dehydrogenase n=1 Tax=Hermanssonia centrifuga TaxID=98765 RepID=A0A2R6NNR6_9APHY|nr:hypothetical protein PHLCEN_2v10223 [Hermanssonia centrifuga]
MFSPFLLTLFVSAALAAPAVKTSRCNVSKTTLTLPSNQSGTTLAAPQAGGPRFIAVAIGVQNYTCASTGTYTSVGALAELFDVSCLPSSLYSDVTDIAWDGWKDARKDITAAEVIKDLAVFDPPFVLGQHYFITNPITGSGLSPKWDFTSASEDGKPNAYVVGAKTGDILSPTDSAINIDWLSLSDAKGDLANQVFRVQTRGGQPPTSCTPGSPEIYVRYASQYWLYGGSF